MLGRMLAERDFVLRVVEQLAEAIARALKLAREAKPAEARAGLREACRTALGIEHSILSMLDARSAVELLGAPERVEAYVQLVEGMAQVEREAGDAQELKRRALELCEAGLSRKRTPGLEALRNRL